MTEDTIRRSGLREATAKEILDLYLEERKSKEIKMSDKELTRNDVNRIVEETIVFIKERIGDNPILIGLVLNQGLNRGHIGGQLEKAKTYESLEYHTND